MAEILVIRHGETEWSASGQHTSVTDLPLTAKGEAEAARLRPVLAGRAFAAVLCSPRVRAIRTAELAGLAITEIDDDLAEWRYGDYEGITTAEIRDRDPSWDLWRDGCPGGEKPDEVGARLDRVLAKARALADERDVVLVAHGHSLRVATARWLGQPVAAGALYLLDTATISALGHEHGTPVLHRWNERPETER
ncbi:MAG TPA: histidine phosphatase family protein [Micromonosporaceae bacterium]